MRISLRINSNGHPVYIRTGVSAFCFTFAHLGQLIYRVQSNTKYPSTPRYFYKTVIGHGRNFFLRLGIILAKISRALLENTLRKCNGISRFPISAKKRTAMGAGEGGGGEEGTWQMRLYCSKPRVRTSHERLPRQATRCKRRNVVNGRELESYSGRVTITTVVTHPFFAPKSISSTRLDTSFSNS